MKMEMIQQTLEVLSGSVYPRLPGLSDASDSPNYDLGVFRLVADPYIHSPFEAMSKQSTGDQPTLEFLSKAFLDTLSPLPETRRRAESSLSDASDSPDYGLAVLGLIAEPSIDDAIRQAAAINFKNHLKSRWTNSIPDPEKEQIKSIVVTVMLSSSPRIRSQLSETLSVIGKHVFLKALPALLPDLCRSLQNASNTSDYVSVNWVLATVNSLFKKFRYEDKSKDLSLDLKYCLDNFAETLWHIFERTSTSIDTALFLGGLPATLFYPLIESQRLCCRIFYSLNFQYVPEFFKVTMDKWMHVFKYYLTVKFPTLEKAGTEGVELVDGLRAAVCDNVNLCMEKEENMFQRYLIRFVDAVSSQLVFASASASSSRDRFTVTALKFLTTVNRSMYVLFSVEPDFVHLICEDIVIPNVMLRDEDEELFDMDYVEFIRRDMEGRDLDARRRIACEFLKSFIENIQFGLGFSPKLKERASVIISNQIQACLTSFAQNPATNWKHKDCAIYLAVSFATKKVRGNLVLTGLVEVGNFYASVIVPELRSLDINGFPMLKAGALKFIIMFRNQMPKPIAMTLFPDVVRFLNSDSSVVHSYAASWLEKLLLIKDDGARARYTSADIGPYLLELMRNLFNALEKQESEENQYVMKCIMRVLGVADISIEVASTCINRLSLVLNRVCENPKNPIFNHYLFEAVAVLVRRACERNTSLVPTFERSLFPSLEMILAKDVAEFFPYAFQLLSQLVELNNPPIPPHYMQIFDILLLPDPWKKPGNVPALERLLQSFLKKAPHELNKEGTLNQVLDILNKLVTAPRSDEGFYVLDTIIEILEYNVIKKYIREIWTFLFLRLGKYKSAKSAKSLVISMSLFLVKHGPQKLAASFDAFMPGLFVDIIEQIWIPILKHITGSIELKLTAVASTRLICESPVFLDPSAGRLWGKMLDSIVTLLSRPEQDRVEEELEVPDFGETVGYNATSVHLYNAGKKEEDPLKDIKDPKQYLVANLENISAQAPGRYAKLICKNLEQANQAALSRFCCSYSCSMTLLYNWFSYEDRLLYDNEVVDAA